MDKRFLVVPLLLIALCSFGFQQQGRKSVTLDNDDVGPSRPPAPAPSILQTAPGEYSLEGGGFTVRMPGTPKSASQKFSDAGGELTLNLLSAKPAGILFFAFYSDLPVSIPESQTELFFDGIRDEMLENPDAKLVSEKKINSGDYPGRELTVTEGGKTSIRRTYLAGNRMFGIAAESLGKLVVTPEIAQFFASLKIAPIQ